ncbi:hypothetical protein Anapl_08848 [Anas platyrhynchos]|uniref:Uncharacterized protein n=1 Tax=Anas platyrhynchos TaxID=8839 RepID=R0LC67_ANAPL|nr:hypothetical protein Anapl_08848 [Anas platyrhynchos]
MAAGDAKPQTGSLQQDPKPCRGTTKANRFLSKGSALPAQHLQLGTGRLLKEEQENNGNYSDEKSNESDFFQSTVDKVNDISDLTCKTLHYKTTTTANGLRW